VNTSDLSSGIPRTLISIADVFVLAAGYFAVLAWGGNELWAIALIAIVALGAFGVRLLAEFTRERIHLRWNWIYAPLLLFLALNLVAIVGGRAGISSGSVEAHTTTTYLLLALSCAAIVFLAGDGLKSRSHVKWFVIGIIALGAFEAVYGLIQYLGDYDYIWQYKRGISTPQASGTLINRNHYALLLNICICTGIGYLYYNAHRLVEGFRFSWRAALSSPGSPKLLWMLFWMILMGVSVIFSMSRMGIAAMAAGLGAILIASSAVRAGSKAATVGLLLMIAVLGFAVYIGVDAVLVRYESLALEPSADQDRVALWRDAWKMVQENPWFGQGLGTFQWTYPAYETVNPDKPARYAHNDYLQILIETGIVGLGLLLWFFVAVWRVAIRNLKNDRDPLVRGIGLGTIGALTAIALQEITDFGLYIPGVAVVAALIVGLNLRAQALSLRN
jgi:O-antigen ligase